MKQEEKMFIHDLLGRMTTEEKIGQLRQASASIAGAFELSLDDMLGMLADGKMTKEAFYEKMGNARKDYHEDDIRAGRIGAYGGVTDPVQICRLQKIAVEESRLHIPILFGFDVVHGFRTTTPIPLAESCAWDPALWEATAALAAKEAADAGISMTYAPMVDVAKDARWGRIAESAGEDTLLNAVYGAAKVKGFQGNDPKEPGHIAACAKHFAGYGAVEAGRDYNRVCISRGRLRNDYLPPFQACVEAGALAIMPAFHDLNGRPCTCNGWLLSKILRQEWGYEGMAVSDSNAIAELVSHGVAGDLTDAAAQALAAGVDMDMNSLAYPEHLAEALAKGKVSLEDLDTAAGHVLHVKYALGLFEDPYRGLEKTMSGKHAGTCGIQVSGTDTGMEEPIPAASRQLARRAAQESIVLLKNDRNILPLSKDAKIVVLGSLSQEAGEMNGTWSLGARDADAVSLRTALEARGVRAVYPEEHQGSKESEERKEPKEPEGLTDLKENALQEVGFLPDADCCLVCLGEHKIESGEAASRGILELPREQLELFDRAKASGKPVIVILFNGRPLAIPGIAAQATAILEAWHPGTEAGNAICDILFGDVNPSAKLTASFPQTAGQCPVYYDHPNTGRPAGKFRFTSKYIDIPTAPIYPFGYGLSYTTFEYQDLQVCQIQEKIHVKVTVRNTGSREGSEIVQCYLQDPVAYEARPVRKLAAFERVPLKPGESHTITFIIPPASIGYYDEMEQYHLDDGEIWIYAGSSSAQTLKTSMQYRKIPQGR